MFSDSFISRVLMGDKQRQTTANNCNTKVVESEREREQVSDVSGVYYFHTVFITSVLLQGSHYSLHYLFIVIILHA